MVPGGAYQVWLSWSQRAPWTLARSFSTKGTFRSMRVLQVIGSTRRTGHRHRCRFHHPITGSGRSQSASIKRREPTPSPQPGDKPVSKPLPESCRLLESSDRPWCQRPARRAPACLKSRDADVPARPRLDAVVIVLMDGGSVTRATISFLIRWQGICTRLPGPANSVNFHILWPTLMPEVSGK